MDGHELGNEFYGDEILLDRFRKTSEVFFGADDHPFPDWMEPDGDPLGHLSEGVRAQLHAHAGDMLRHALLHALSYIHSNLGEYFFSEKGIELMSYGPWAMLRGFMLGLNAAKGDVELFDTDAELKFLRSAIERYHEIQVMVVPRGQDEVDMQAELLGMRNDSDVTVVENPFTTEGDDDPGKES
jgi:hypothetical protein